MDTYWCPQGLDFQEDVHDATISKEGNHPEEEEQHTEEVGNKGIGRGKLRPVRVYNNSHQILRDPIGHLHAWGIGLVVLGVQVQTRDGASGFFSGTVSHSDKNKKFSKK